MPPYYIDGWLETTTIARNNSRQHDAADNSIHLGNSDRVGAESRYSLVNANKSISPNLAVIDEKMQRMIANRDYGVNSFDVMSLIRKEERLLRDVQIKLAGDFDTNTRAELAASCNLTSTVAQFMLASDKHYFVRLCLAGNSNASASAIKVLYEDAMLENELYSMGVRSCNDKEFKIYAKIRIKESSEILDALYKNPNFSKSKKSQYNDQFDVSKRRDIVKEFLETINNTCRDNVAKTILMSMFEYYSSTMFSGIYEPVRNTDTQKAGD